MTEALVPYEVTTLADTMKLGEVLAKSGFFKDSRDASQAVVKVLAGREMGFGPVASMTGIHIIEGKPSIGANLMAAAVKRSGRYDYTVVKLDATEAVIMFWQRNPKTGQWVEIGESVFTIADAKAAGVANKNNWKSYPKNMLFARAMSNGVRWYCPDVFGGATVYAPEELGATVDGETGEVIDVPVVVSTPAPASTNGATELEQFATTYSDGTPVHPEPTANSDAPARDLGGDWDDERKRKAVDWAMRKHPDVFGHRRHAENALNKVMTDNPDLDNGELAQAWIDDCERRQTERDETFLSDAEMDEPTHADLDAQAAAEA